MTDSRTYLKRHRLPTCDWVATVPSGSRVLGVAVHLAALHPPAVYSSSCLMVSELSYTFEYISKVTWTAAQEKSLSTDFPFDLDHESDEQYVVRTYLQFLWLPEVCH